MISLLVLFILIAVFSLPCESKPVSIGLGKKHVMPSYKNYHRRALEAGVPSLPVWGNVWPVAIYWTYIRVGTPLQKYPVALDTGSMTLDIVGPNCTNCITKPPNRVYNPQSSATSRTLYCSDAACPNSCDAALSFRASQSTQCAFSNTYETCDLSNPDAPCTISGFWYQDVATFGNLPPVNVSFGAITFQTTNFDQFQNIDGLVGLIQTGSGPDPTDVFLTLFQQGSVKRNIFAMCLLMKAGKASNGSLTLGGIDSTLYSGPISYTPNCGGSLGGGYGMQLNSLTVFGGAIYAVATPCAILDSGTNVLLLPDKAFSAVYASFIEACFNNGISLVGTCDVPIASSLWGGVCFNLTQAQINAYPTLTLNIQNVDIVMPPSTYLTLFDPESPNPLLYCLGIRNTGPDGFTIIGDTSMSNYYVVFDNEQTRIGWAKVSPACGSQSI